MEARQILSFLQDLSENNNRQWFSENRVRYEDAKTSFERIVEELIAQISLFDPSVKTLRPKDCTYRIYRDVRFHDKDTPYKIHFGAYIAPHGGRRSDYAGYYFHMQPGGQSMLSAGIWTPKPNVLKALRRSIFDNYEEFLEIIENEELKKVYGDSFYEDGMLKIAPVGFPKDFSGIYYLKLKHFLLNLDDKFFQSAFPSRVAELFRLAYPFNRFLNYTVDELKGI